MLVAHDSWVSRSFLHKAMLAEMKPSAWLATSSLGQSWSATFHQPKASQPKTMYTPLAKPSLDASHITKRARVAKMSRTTTRCFALYTPCAATAAWSLLSAETCMPLKPAPTWMSRASPSSVTFRRSAESFKIMAILAQFWLSPTTVLTESWPKALAMAIHAALKVVSGMMVRKKFGNAVLSLRSGRVALLEIIGNRAALASDAMLMAVPEQPEPRRPTGSGSTWTGPHSSM
mmetsp:Transcript_43044/g.130016  ORF Transcript_43044/g.130016 Transcript_43044/m.130016 type:complete len:232 (+) Transcript_43044:2957-3652(+)